MRKILGLFVLCFITAPHAFAEGEIFPDHTYTGTVFKNTHKNISRTSLASSGAVWQDPRKNTTTQKSEDPAMMGTRIPAMIGYSGTTTWTGLISPTEWDLIERLSWYFVPRNSEISHGDPIRARALVFLSMAAFFFCVELFTWRLYALSVSIVSVGVTLWVLLMHDITMDWWHAGGFVLGLAGLWYVLPRTIRAYAEDLHAPMRNNEDPTI